jgi:hypothetical protein
MFGGKSNHLQSRTIEVVKAGKNRVVRSQILGEKTYFEVG